MNAEKERIARMLDVDPSTDDGKVAVMHVALGHVAPADTQAAECACGWEGTIEDCNMIRYRSDDESWSRLAGRAGLHWKCPKCDEIVWKYYNVIS